LKLHEFHKVSIIITKSDLKEHKHRIKAASN